MPPGYELKFHGEAFDPEFRQAKTGIIGNSGSGDTGLDDKPFRSNLIAACRMPKIPTVQP